MFYRIDNLSNWLGIWQEIEDLFLGLEMVFEKIRKFKNVIVYSIHEIIYTAEVMEVLHVIGNRMRKI